MTKRVVAHLALAATLLLTPISAMAQTPIEDRLADIADTVIIGCADDLSSHCGKVAPGEGRVIACLYAHEDKLSDRCTANLKDVRLQLQRVQNMLGYVAGQCMKEVEKHCSDVEPGEGRVIQCLDKAGDAVPESCQVAIDDLLAE